MPASNPGLAVLSLPASPLDSPPPCPRVSLILPSRRPRAWTADGSKEFNAFEVGWKLFDQEGKGHIDSADLRRVCLEMGYKVSQRDVDNMIAVMAPTQRPLPASGGSAADGANVDEVAAAEAAASGMHAKISFERYTAPARQLAISRPCLPTCHL